MSFDTLTLAVDDGLAVVTLDNPPMNAIDEAARHELNDLFDELRAKDSEAGDTTKPVLKVSEP